MTSYMLGQKSDDMYIFSKVFTSNANINREFVCTVAEIFAIFLPIIPYSMWNRAMFVCFYVVLYNVSGHVRYSEMKERFLASPRRTLILSDEEESYEGDEDEDDNEDDNDDDYEEEDEDDESYEDTDHDATGDPDVDTDTDPDATGDTDTDPDDKKNN
jgi:hypothetical protein